MATIQNSLFNKKNSTLPRILFYISILLFVILPICCADARTPLEMPLEGEMKSEEMIADSEKCEVKNVALQAVMDRVCELCHDMYSHQVPDMRALCRFDCFRSDQFKKCLRLFKPSRSSRTHMRWNSGYQEFLFQL